MAGKKTNNSSIHIDSDDDITGVAEDDRPLMQLFRRLINGHDNKQNTVLTNSHLVDVLHIEFNISQPKTHGLEIDIYTNIIKRFLKDWPLWDEFDKNIIQIQEKKDPNFAKTILNDKYLSLKEFLKKIIDDSKQQATKMVEKLKVVEKNARDSNTSRKTVMEIQCRRDQLNNLFYQRPMPEFNNSIFNLSTVEPLRISLTVHDLKTILNSSHVSISIYRDSLVLKRDMSNTTQHLLVNKKLGHKKPVKMLDSDLLYKVNKSKEKFVNKLTLLKYLHKFIDQLPKQNTSNDSLYQIVFQMIIHDIKYLPDSITFPRCYKKTLNPYQYVRYLYTEVPQVENDDKYDLQLEETLTPECEYYIHRISLDTVENYNAINWMTIECVDCEIKFTGSTLCDNLQEHFDKHHIRDPDWQCVNCKRKFKNMHLAAHFWSHKCEEPVENIEI